jgi:two-component system cell cycle sensor histidine kinase/response regulator CckA
MNAQHVLIVDDDPNLRKTLSAILKARGYRPTAVGTGKAALERIEEEPPDVALIDLRLEDIPGLEVMQWFKERWPATECIVLTGHASQASAIEAINLGAYSYVQKPYDAEQLLVTIRRAIEKREAEQTLRRERNRCQTYLDIVGVMLVALNQKGEITLVNRKGCQVLGYEEDALIGRNWFDTCLPTQIREEASSVFQLLMAGDTDLVGYYENPVLTSSGEERIIAWHNTVLTDEAGTITGTLGSGEDVTERKRVESQRDASLEELSAERNLLRTLIDNMPDFIYVKDRESRFLVGNIAVARLMGVATPDGLLGNRDFDFYPEELAARYYAGDQEVMATGEPLIAREEPGADSEGNMRWFSTTKAPLRDAAGEIIGIVGIGRDITERMQVEEERENLQAQLLQSQKMEAVGQLTAGIAHDFNNLLTAITGFAQLIQLRLAPDDPIQGMVVKIWDSGQRAAGLVRQLMTFSRRQIIDPQLLDLNAAVADMDDMLLRVIREDVELKMALAPDLWPVMVDPAQIEQVIVNLAVNAADAMPHGGKLTIETSNVVLDENYVADHLEAQPGEHVLLAVSDTGVGMSHGVQAHLFEPFFTTKERGEGTGLGLATVYGIVKQSGGDIWVYSQEGHGTAFKIYLPRAEGTVELLPRAEEAGARAMPAGGETILLVEDNAEVRGLARQVLERQGYTLLEAGNGQQALALAASHTGPIHLLLTDVIMPGMSGSSLSERLVQSHPDVRILYMSGYTDDTIRHHGVLGTGIAFLQKPFNSSDLARKVRTVLDE